MKQEPTYVLIGDGRLARHLAEYFRLSEVEISSWSRSDQSDLHPLLRTCSHILLAISDGAVEGFHHQWRTVAGRDALWIHFCGGRTFEGITRAHPLMTFNSDLYDLPTYRQIPFVVERGGPSFSSILPSFDNPAFELPEEQTALYHAWAVLAGSATASTWREYRRVASKTLGLPEHVLHPYLKQVARNSLDLDAPMTGPVARADGEAIASNLEALLGSPYQGLYRELVKIFAPEEH